MPPMTRGPLPARTYWVRRVMVLGTAVLLVVAIARLLGGGSDGKDDGDAASLTDGTPTSSAPTVVESSASVTPSGTGTNGKKGKPGKGVTTSTAPVLAEPTGECTGSDIAVTPKVGNATAGRDVLVVLQLRTISAEACTWSVSSQALAVNITSGQDAIWNSRECPKSIPRRDVVVRKAVTTNVGITWKGAKRSGDTCIIGTGWAMPGWYHVTAAALGGEPSDVQFELKTPVAGTVTVTATPTQSPSEDPSGTASGAVEPNGQNG
jgi:hypothetical protein